MAGYYLHDGRVCSEGILCCGHDGRANNNFVSVLAPDGQANQIGLKLGFLAHVT
jgi:hypothetical protein